MHKNIIFKYIILDIIIYIVFCIIIKLYSKLSIHKFLILIILFFVIKIIIMILVYFINNVYFNKIKNEFNIYKKEILIRNFKLTNMFWVIGTMFCLVGVIININNKILINTITNDIEELMVIAPLFTILLYSIYTRNNIINKI